MLPPEFSNVSGRLEYAPSGKPDHWLCRCPLVDRHRNGDRRMSASLRIVGGDLQIRCFRCSQEMGRKDYFRLVCWVLKVSPIDWMAAERRQSGSNVGACGKRLNMATRPIEKTYDYRDATGRLLYQCVRYSDTLQPKFHYRRPARQTESPGVRVTKDEAGKSWVWDANCGEWQNGLGEIVPESRHECLYRLPEILKSSTQPVLIAEGEKDADNLAGLGFVATTNPHGACNFKYHLAAELSGRRCVLFEDNDESGRRHVAQVSGMLIGAGAASIRIVTFRDMPEKSDVTDWLLSLQDGDNKSLRAAVIQRVKESREWQPVAKAA